MTEHTPIEPVCFHPSLIGVKIEHEVQLEWKQAGDLIKGQSFKDAKNASGLYAFVEEQGPVLYIGKAGGLKPGEPEDGNWANNIKQRLANHWKSGAFRGLVKIKGLKIQAWFIDLRRALGSIWERDLEQIESELICWLRNTPGNSAYDGTSERRFEVIIWQVDGKPLPVIILKPEISYDTRKRDRRSRSSLPSSD